MCDRGCQIKRCTRKDNLVELHWPLPLVNRGLNGSKKTIWKLVLINAILDLLVCREYGRLQRVCFQRKAKKKISFGNRIDPLYKTLIQNVFIKRFDFWVFYSYIEITWSIKVFVWLSKVTESNFDLMNNVTSFCEGCLYKFKKVPLITEILISSAVLSF